ncbi:MAG: 1-(5-phosphoribosyl)-5-[(5-phosphoribosylamino)methylideneamino]imidazole-4-carboxamide isomerase [Bacteroidetes bacterium]|nr:MAG: 1-(5-phosphoribosyl)-5-[(5-phosphoribosylamino)methylideneamino]imidazole-4-carboxamide isomerase [Bacteroidota bacterium]
MLKQFVIPAIDVIDGKCVRLSQGNYAQKTVYNERPLEVARQFEDAGITRLHLVDLDGAKAGKVVNWKVLETLATHTKLAIDFGGGIKTAADVSTVLNSGAALATIGSLAVKQPEIFASLVAQFGAQHFFIGADVMHEKLAVSGWLEQTDLLVYDFINQCKLLGITQFFCTDIEKDGMMQGPSTALYARILERCPGVQLTASGGATTLADLQALHQIGCIHAIVGKALYEGTILLSQL